MPSGSRDHSLDSSGLAPAASIDVVDRIAIIASMACMVHCLALPLLIALLPALSDVLNVPESFHWWMLVLAVPTSSFALVSGWRAHRRFWPAVFGVIGLAGLTIGVAVFEGSIDETIFTVAGGIALCIAHVGNWRGRHVAHVHEAGRHADPSFGDRALVGDARAE